jgi:hypothetical protein
MLRAAPKNRLGLQRVRIEPARQDLARRRDDRVVARASVIESSE